MNLEDFTPEKVNSGILYIAGAFALWPVGKYLIKPVIDRIRGFFYHTLVHPEEASVLIREEEIKAEQYRAMISTRKELFEKL